jgi:hypothetical protein
MKRHTCIICGKKRNAEYMQAVERYGQGLRYVCKEPYGGWGDHTGKTCKEKYDDKMSESWGYQRYSDIPCSER